MNNISLNLEEQKILWIALNNAQNQGIIGLSKTVETIGQYEPNSPIVNDWFKQTAKEYDLINSLKAKLCSDLLEVKG